RRERVSGGVARNMPARDFLRTLVARDELHQQTFVARYAVTPSVEVQAGGGIFENERRSPGQMRGSAVAALLEEAQLKFQGVQGVARVSWHRHLPDGHSELERTQDAVTVNTWRCDGCRAATEGKGETENVSRDGRGGA